MKKLIALTAGIIATAFALTSCSTSVANKVSPKEFADVIKNSSVVIVDVRTPAEYASGHLANAVNVDFESADFKSNVAQLDKAKTYAVYCRSGNRSGQAVKVMEDAGFTNLYDLDGGINDWVAAGGQVVK